MSSRHYMSTTWRRTSSAAPSAHRKPGRGGMRDEGYPESAPGGDANWGRCEDMKDRSHFGGWVGNLLVPYSKNVNIFTCPSNPKLSNVNYGKGCAGSSGTDAAAAMAKWGIPYVW